jgi:uncharacterized short protein YbdD (DUF466 family)
MRRWVKMLVETAELMVGVPDYDRYLVAHHASGRCGPPLDRGAFCRERARRRFGADGGGGVRCC